jgi:hypothetical protein
MRMSPTHCLHLARYALDPALCSARIDQPLFHPDILTRTLASIMVSQWTYSNQAPTIIGLVVICSGRIATASVEALGPRI